MDLVHHYLLNISEEKRHPEIDRVLLEGRVGPAVDDRGIPMPSWWVEDDENMDDATQNMLAMGSWRGGGK